MIPALTSLPSNSTIYPLAEFSFVAIFQLFMSSSVPAFGKCHILTVGFFFASTSGWFMFCGWDCLQVQFCYLEIKLVFSELGLGLSYGPPQSFSKASFIC